MKKGYLSGIFSTTLLVSMLVSSCGEKQENKDTTTIEFQELSYDFVAKVDGLTADDFSMGDGTKSISGSLILPVGINNNDITQLRDSVMKMANVVIDENGAVKPVLEEGESLTEVSPESVESSMETTNNLTICLINSKLIVWEDYYYDYEGGAHGLWGTQFINYSITLNKILNLKDILTPGFEEKLNDIIRDHLELAYKNGELDVELDEIEYPNVYKISPAGIEFVFPLYSIGPYSEGERKVMVGIEELRSEGLINTTVEKEVF